MAIVDTEGAVETGYVPPAPVSDEGPAPAPPAPGTTPGMRRADTPRRSDLTPVLPVPGTDPWAPAPTGTPLSGGQQDALSILRTTLDRYGLGSLSDWALQQIQAGNSQSLILENLRQTTEYKDRFSGMALRQAAGFGPLSEEEYISYENTLAGYLQAAGLPRDFYDTPQELGQLIGSFANPAQVAERVQQGWERVTQAPTEVRSAFAEFFGPSGDAALAAFFLDPDKATPVLEQMITTAGVAGAGRRTGVFVDQATADRIGRLGFSDAQVAGGMQNVRQLDPLFSQLPSEQVGLSQQTGLDAAFGLSGDASKLIQQRLDTRKADFAGPGGGAAQTSQGLVGLGAQRGQR